MIFLQKNTWKYDKFFKCFEKMVFPKKLHCNMVFLISWGKMAFFFPENNILFLRTENERWYFSKNTWKYHVFCMLVKVVFSFPTNMKLPFCQKSKDDLFLKNAPKDDISRIAEKDYIDPRKGDIGILYTFYGDIFQCFHILLSNKQNTINLIYRVKIWLYL